MLLTLTLTLDFDGKKHEDINDGVNCWCPGMKGSIREWMDELLITDTSLGILPDSSCQCPAVTHRVSLPLLAHTPRLSLPLGLLCYKYPPSHMFAALGARLSVQSKSLLSNWSPGGGAAPACLLPAASLSISPFDLNESEEFLVQPSSWNTDPTDSRSGADRLYLTRPELKASSVSTVALKWALESTTDL